MQVILGKTLAEKILSNRSGSDARAGDIVIAGIDLSFVQDTTGPLTVRQFETSGFAGLVNSSRTVLFIDHAAPSPSSAGRREAHPEGQGGSANPESNADRFSSGHVPSAGSAPHPQPADG